MTLDAERFARARALFDTLADVPPQARAALWAANEPVDDAIRAQVEAWLAANAGETRETAIESVRADWHQGQCPLHAGQRLGAFELITPIGAGGMGTVWLGERRDGGFCQRVAIKLMTAAGAQRGEFARRFLTEREILAALDHPGIARLIDGGETADGTPYLLMDFVEGESIDRWCASRRATLDTRIRLVLSVCDALQAAHSALIVHRDLKPGNILVDAQGRPRLLDFGIAKVIDERDLIHTAVQTAADQRLMTLRYASPEQVRGERVGTTSDLYSLGVVLYELLAGASPYGDDHTTSLGLMQAICEQDPAPPSQLARRRSDSGDTTLDRARRGFGADLDAIVLKALRKSPGERYPSIGAFADDLCRLLDGLPVQARQGDGWYRARKFGRRHRTAIAIALTAMVALAIVALNWRWQRDSVAHERDKAVRTTRFLADLFEQANPMRHRGEIPDAVAMAERGAQALQRDPTLAPETRAELLLTSSRVLLSLGQFDKAIATAEAGLSGAERWSSQQPGLVWALRLTQADALANFRKPDEGIAIVTAMLADPDLHDGVVEGRALRTEALTLLARMTFERNLLPEAEAAQQQAEASWRDSFGRSIDDVAGAKDWPPESGDLLAAQWLTRCRIAVVRERNDIAERQCAQAQAVRERQFPDGHPGRLNALQELSTLAGNAGNDARELSLERQIFAKTRAVFGDHHPRTGIAALNLGVSLRRAGSLDEAIAMYRLAHGILVETRGADHPHALLALNNWANVAYAAGDYRAALAMHRDVQVRRRAVLPEGDPDRAQSALNVAKCLWRMGAADEAAIALAEEPIPADAGEARAHRALAALIALDQGDATVALIQSRSLKRDILAGGGDVRDLAPATWAELRALAATGADHVTLESAYADTEAALGRDVSRDFVTEAELVAWRARHLPDQP